IDDSAFTTVRASAVQVSQTGSGLITALVSDTSFTNGNIAVDLGHSLSGDLTFNVSRNTFIGNDSNVINFSASATSNNNGDVRGIIDNNRIGNGTPDSGSRDAFGIGIDAIGDVDMVLSIINNVIRNTDFAGIFAEAAFDTTSGGEKALFDLTLRDNDVGTPDDNSAFPFGTVFGTRIESRHDSDLCLDIAGNTSNDVGGVGDFQVRQRGTTGANNPPIGIFRLERFVGNGLSVTDVQNFIIAQNDAGSTANATLVTGFTGVANGTCRKP
ncbi:hypothetical protein, partial [Methyloglobulus sp.]|uniref:hypothetical protein n=1 Tax=Methyloglobulus sp. TaxID=2518622 RepID=UPI003988D9C4